jgi:acetyltransferase-like isoleucine patch superfamily enzyme
VAPGEPIARRSLCRCDTAARGSGDRRRKLNPRARRLLQRAFDRLARLEEEALEIRHGDPLARRFAEFGEGSVVQAPRVALINPSGVAIGAGVILRSYLCIEALSPPGTVVLRLGDRVHVGHNVRFVAWNGIEIAEDAGIGHGSTIADTIHDWSEVLDGKPPAESSFMPGPPLRIEAGAWIGNNCVVNGGITIGERAIVAPNSVVTRDVPPETMVSGNPGRRVPLARPKADAES